jgi:hypothetical protein
MHRGKIAGDDSYLAQPLPTPLPDRIPTDIVDAVAPLDILFNRHHREVWGIEREVEKERLVRVIRCMVVEEVEVRRVNFGSVTTQVGEPTVVRENQDHVRSLFRRQARSDCQNENRKAREEPR